MAQSSGQLAVYLEIGKERTFAGVIDWPGWCRSGRDEASALKELFDYRPRYEEVLHASGGGLSASAAASAFNVVERLVGNATTDFGAPGVPPSSDSRPADAAELERLQGILKACWAAFDDAVGKAKGKEFRYGPRGGGRDLDSIIQHTLDGEASYLSRMAWKLDKKEGTDPAEALNLSRQAVLSVLERAARGEAPAQGSPGRVQWTPRYFVRRAAWHVLDHAWEIHDRVI